MSKKDWFLDYTFIAPFIITKAMELDKLEELKEEMLKKSSKPLFLYGLKK